jgi:virulence-associated protein VapD
MYAIAFDMDTKTMEAEYGGPHWRNGYAEVGDALREHGFDHQQGSVYFGTEKVEAVTCVLAVQDLARRMPWFRAAVRDIRMLRIEDNNDLSVAIEATPPAPLPDRLFEAPKLVVQEPQSKLVD